MVRVKKTWIRIVFSKGRLSMIEKEIEFEGNIYYENGKIQSGSTTYIEYRNDKIQKIKFFEYKDGRLCEAQDKEKLKKAILSKYEIFNGIIE